MAAAPAVLETVLVTPKRTHQPLLHARVATAVTLTAEAAEPICHGTVLILEVVFSSKVTVEWQP